MRMAICSAIAGRSAISGAAQAGNVADNGTSPIFRTFYPTYTPTRIFPKASNLVAGIFTNVAAPHGETLPITNRTFNFRLTARDNRSGGGAINTADMPVTVIENGAGFAVTAPSGGSVLSGFQRSRGLDRHRTQICRR